MGIILWGVVTGLCLGGACFLMAFLRRNESLIEPAMLLAVLTGIVMAAPIKATRWDLRYWIPFGVIVLVAFIAGMVVSCWGDRGTETKE